MNSTTNENIDPIISHYTVDMSSNNNFVQAHAAQGDGNDTRQVVVELISNNVPYIVDPANVYVTIAGTKPDGKEIWNECGIDEMGNIIIYITYQMTTTVGRGNYQVVLMDKASNKQLKSFPFYLIVVAAAFDPTYIMSQNEFQALSESITASEAAARRSEEAADRAEISGAFGVMSIGSMADYPTEWDKVGHLYFERGCSEDEWRGDFEISRAGNPDESCGHLIVEFRPDNS